MLLISFFCKISFCVTRLYNATCPLVGNVVESVSWSAGRLVGWFAGLVGWSDGWLFGWSVYNLSLVSQHPQLMHDCY